MALIRQSSTGTITRDAVVLDLGDLSRQGEQLKTKARADADRILAEARAERERLLAGAAEEGRAAGHAKGLEQGQREGHEAGRQAALAEMKQRLATLETGWTAALAKFEAERDNMLLEARHDVLRLACVGAELATKRAVRVEPDRVVDQVGAVLALISRPTRLTLSIHPDDRALLEEALPGLTSKYTAATHVEIATADSLDRGSCIARTGTGGEIDASIRTQLERIIESLMPEAAAGAQP
jgi:flagellar assembly protein FliH